MLPSGKQAGLSGKRPVGTFWGEGDAPYLDGVGLLLGLHRGKHMPTFRECTLGVCPFHSYIIRI